MSHDPMTLPADLPVPVDDGAAAHLPGHVVPSLLLRATSGDLVDPCTRSQGGTVVIFVYPRTGRPGVDPPSGWDAIPGARGCTPEVCGVRDLYTEFVALGAEVYGLSTQDSEYQ